MQFGNDARILTRINEQQSRTWNSNKKAWEYFPLALSATFEKCLHVCILGTFITTTTDFCGTLSDSQRPPLNLKHYVSAARLISIDSQITSLTIVYWNVYSGADQTKHQNSASLAFVRGIHRWPVNSPHKGPVTRECFHLMTSSCVSALASIDGVGINLSPQWLKYFMTNTWNHPWINTLDNPWWRHQMERIPRNWPFVRGIHRPSMNSPHKGQWCGALMLSLICAWLNGWVNIREAGDLRRHRAHYDVIVILILNQVWLCSTLTDHLLVVWLCVLKFVSNISVLFSYYTVEPHTINTVTNWHPVLSWTCFSNVWMCVYWSSDFSPHYVNQCPANDWYEQLRT